MGGPSSSPRGERAGSRPGAWETELVLGSEHLLEDDQEQLPHANRATRRAARRRGLLCGNNPTVQLTPGDQQVLEEFRAYLAGHRDDTAPTEGHDLSPTASRRGRRRPG